MLHAIFVSREVKKHESQVCKPASKRVITHCMISRAYIVPLLAASLSLVGRFSVGEEGSTPSSQTWLHSVQSFDATGNAMTLRQKADPEKPFTVAGECGAVMGQQSGGFEAWIFPVKLFSGMTIQARVDRYDEPIDVNSLASEIEVSPDHTTITYSHIAFTLKEILFATQCAHADGAGVMALFQVSSVRPVTLTFSFTPEMKAMWPAPISSSVDPEWVRVSDSDAASMNDTVRPGGAGASYPAGWYMLHTDLPGLAGAVAMPDAAPGILPPYQEKPRTWPLQFVLRYDPDRDNGRSYPLLMAVSSTPQTATKQALENVLAKLNSGVASLYRENADYYAHFFDKRTTAETPDSAFDRDLRWAEVAIDQVRVRHRDEVGLVAGFFSSGSSARPGFGWFFGRDTLFTTWAINSYGDYPLTKDALNFLIARQRQDGKMPHEFSQSADVVDWASLPYEYAAADSTPLFLLAAEDYVNSSGDKEFLQAAWPAIQKAWNFETTHDSDGDGIYDNAQGTGWVESWPQGMPHQEIYLAALDEQASTAMAHLFRSTGHDSEAQQAQRRADAIAGTIQAEYAQPDGMYAFSYGSGVADKTASIFPSIAWWTEHYALPQSGAMFQRWASDEFSTDWGLRDLSEHDGVYDPISYHQGSVWPLFTGWMSLAEYRTGRDLAAYTHLMENANLTTEQDLGAVTELLSGAFYSPFGRSTSHQMWSSAMVLIPALRGLFGVSIDALNDTITVDPHLPAQWPSATLRHVRIGEATVDLRYERRGASMHVSLLNAPPDSKIALKSASPSATTLKDGTELVVPLPAVEVGVCSGAADTLPLPGARTMQMKILDEQRSPTGLVLQLEAPGGSTQRLFVRRNATNLHLAAEGAVLNGNDLSLSFPEGNGYQLLTVTLRW